MERALWAGWQADYPGQRQWRGHEFPDHAGCRPWATYCDGRKGLRQIRRVSYTLVVNFVEGTVVGTTNQVAELEQERDTALAERNTAQD